MDAADVLKEYLELFSCDCRQLKLLVAPNAVVDWFGRSVRGPAKIHDYLRFEVNPHYEHVNFDKAESCEPIEQRPTHWKTKALPIGDVDFVQPRNRVTNIASLKSYADSDLDDDDLDMQPLPEGNQTPEHTTKASHISCELTPPASTSKRAENARAVESDADDTVEEADDCGAPEPKRMKRSQPSPFSYLRRMPVNAPMTKVAKRQLPTCDFGMHVLGDDTSSDEEMDSDFKEKVANEYTPLRYLETVGVLRGKAQFSDTSSTPHTSGEWDRPVRLRISYRRRLSDQGLQVALIIYEHLDEATGKSPPTRRRNLMAQFNEAACSETLNTNSNETDVSAEAAQLAAVPLTVTETLVTTSVETGLEEIEETTAFSIVPLRTPTKSLHTPPATPKRRPRVPYSISGMKRINPSPSTPTSTTTTATPKRSAARSLRL